MCPYCNDTSVRIQKRGFYYRQVQGTKKVQRFQCQACRKFFSRQTSQLSFRDKRPELNALVFRLLCMGVSQRETARGLATNPRTVAKKLVRIAGFTRAMHHTFMSSWPRCKDVIFDDMETFEHSKCKPLSITVAVEGKTRRIIAAQVSSMPAKGKLAAVLRKKYGFRPDDRQVALASVLQLISRISQPDLTIRSDLSPRYPGPVRSILPHATHLAYKGRRGCIVGQGELKAGGFDPLFTLNHTCAMIRDQVKRLSRRTWCTTKRPDRLQCLLDIFIFFHNQRMEGLMAPTILGNL